MSIRTKVSSTGATTVTKIKTWEVLRFMKECLIAAGCKKVPAEQQAKLLLQADVCGHRSHGLNRLGRYVHDIRNGTCMPNNKPTVLSETEATAWVDANNVLGATAAHFATDIAIQKAKTAGAAVVAVKGSNHYGMGGYWSYKMADYGLIGMSFSNGSPILAPTRSRKAALGTNPMSVGAPALPECGHFCLDIATSAVSIGKIEMMRLKGQKLPPGWAQGPDGNETDDPNLAIKTGCLMPLGGAEETAGYKGFGLAAMVDILTGQLAGANYGNYIPRWTAGKKNSPPNLGHCFIAIKPDCFAPGFEDRVTNSITTWRNLPPADPTFPVLAPGDIEKITASKVDDEGAIEYENKQLDASNELAKKLNVKPLQLQE